MSPSVRPLQTRGLNIRDRGCDATKTLGSELGDFCNDPSLAISHPCDFEHAAMSSTTSVMTLLISQQYVTPHPSGPDFHTAPSTKPSLTSPRWRQSSSPLYCSGALSCFYYSYTVINTVSLPQWACLLLQHLYLSMSWLFLAWNSFQGMLVQKTENKVCRGELFSVKYLFTK